VQVFQNLTLPFWLGVHALTSHVNYALHRCCTIQQSMFTFYVPHAADCQCTSKHTSSIPQAS